jgi:glucose-specific phosphotransferase system IIA component
MGIFKANKEVKRTKEEILVAPLDGAVVPLTALSDETFAAGLLGDGVGIDPAGGVLCAPCNGRVEQTFDTGHAVTLQSDGGAEILLHVGMDTVALGGRHFDLLVRAGERVKAGQPLIRFDRAAIAEEGYVVATPVVVTNAREFEISVLAREQVTAGEPLLALKRRNG